MPPSLKSRQRLRKSFGVQVKRVNTVNQDGKKKRFRGKPGRTSDFKKAYITLMPGQTLEALQA